MSVEPFDVVLLAAAARMGEAGHAVDLAGGRLIETLAWDAADRLASPLSGGAVLLLEAEGVPAPLLTGALVQVRDCAMPLAPPVVATLATAQIDEMAAMLMAPNVHLLCEPSLAELVGAVAVAGHQSRRLSLSDPFREAEAERLRKLNDEVARIAELLARLATRGAGGGGAPDDVADRHIAFGFEPPAANADPHLVRQAIRARRMRDAFLGENLFEDPAWDMLLDLYAAHLEGTRVSVSSLCIAAAVAPTTALRWIGKLGEAGLLDRHPDPTDRRRAFITLSAKALKGMDGYAAAVRRAGMPIA